MKLSRHDASLLAVCVFVLLFGLIGLNMRKQLDTIKERQSSIQTLRNRVALQKELIWAKDMWTQRYDAVKGKMPVFKPGEQVENYWMRIMDDAANHNNMRLYQRSQREETIVAGVYEFPIEVRSWEGSIESLVKFIYELESEGAMLTIRELRLSAIPNQVGMFKGSFTLNAAYMRAENATVSSASLPIQSAAEEDEEETAEEDDAEDADSPAPTES